MGHKLTIAAPEAAFAALQVAAAGASRTPEALAADAVKQPRLEGGEAREAIRALMHARGHRVEPLTPPVFPNAEPLPPEGTPEREEFELDRWGDLSAHALAHTEVTPRGAYRYQYDWLTG